MATVPNMDTPSESPSEPRLCFVDKINIVFQVLWNVEQVENEEERRNELRDAALGKVNGGGQRIKEGDL